MVIIGSPLYGVASSWPTQTIPCSIGYSNYTVLDVAVVSLVGVVGDTNWCVTLVSGFGV